MTAAPALRAERPSHVLRAVSWMFSATIAMSAMAIVGREISRELTTPQLMFFRSAISVPIVLAAALFTGAGWRQLATRRLGLHAVRNSVHFIGQYGWFYAIAFAPLAQVFALEFTMPIWITLFAPLLLRERLTLPRLAAAVVGFAGILLVVRPDAATLNSGTIAALIAAAGFALSVISVRALTRTETPLQILFFMTLMQAVMALLVSNGVIPAPSLTMWGWLVAVALLGLIAQYAMARAFSLADTMIVVPIDFLRLPLIALAGALLYAETFDPWVLGGGALILAGNYWNLSAERRARTRV